LFSPDGAATQPPGAYAIFTGHVLEAGTLTNALTGHPFHWALVDSYAAQYDVVVDPELLPKTPAAGNVLSGSFWLSGRLLSYPKPDGRPSWFRPIVRGGG
jgi:hypothetical protein